MNNWIKVFTALNAFLLQKSGGRLGNRMGRQSVLLLHTTGRKSGKPYVTPLSYYRDGDTYLLVASNWGKENQPAWLLNLMQQSSIAIRVRVDTIQVIATLAEGEEYQRLWDLVTQKNQQYLQYQKGMSRQIPIVILTPIRSS